MVRGDIPYQTYRDFAKNKGQFHAGATNIPIFNQALIRINMSQMGFKLCRQGSLR
ncbi:S6 family peptidase [Escherichia albertii]